jgi:predicted DsbA family dithiol-disulfide isomerase
VPSVLFHVVERTSNYTHSLSLELAPFRSCFNGEKHKAEIQRTGPTRVRRQINGTPTFVFARTAKDRLDGVRLVGAQP